MNNKWKSFSEDPSASVCWVIYELLNNLLSIFSTGQLFFKAIFWNVKIEYPCRTIGPVHIKKYPKSKIYINKNCLFRSTNRSNLIGINHPCAISTHSSEARIFIGERCGFSGTAIGAKERIELGDHVLCGANTVITDFDWHQVKAEIENRNTDLSSAPIRIGRNVWVGMNSIILKGVEIGENTIIGANSVVTKSLPANVIAAGIPAKIIRDL